mgnify:CR=1 FL=1
MAKYGVEGQTPAGTNLSIIMITGGTTVRPKWYDFMIGSDATPADVATEFSIARVTDAGTGGTALTEAPTDNPAEAHHGQPTSVIQPAVFRCPHPVPKTD